MDVLWTALEFGFCFVIAALALLWLAGRLYGDAGPKGLTLLVAIVAAALVVAYTMAIHQPSRDECVEETPHGRGRC